MNEQETIADIIAEMRKISAEKYRLSGENGGAYGNPGVYYLDFAQFAHVIAERLDAAHKRDAAFHAMTCEANDRLREHLQIALDADKRERGDCAKLREVLKRAWLFVSATRESFAFVHEGRIECDKLCEDIDAALSAPPRNCDAGTAEEQSERFAKYCESEVCKRKRCESWSKPLFSGRCALAWAQMPYEEGVNK